LSEKSKERIYSIDPTIVIRRDLKPGSYRFLEIFSGFDSLVAVKKIFGRNTALMLANLNIELFPRQGFMGVSDEDGHIFASLPYLRDGDLWSVYLDAIHELVHVRQFREGKNLFDPSFSYVDRPTEIEAYRIAAEEARRIGLTESEIFDYLEVPWVTKQELERLAIAVGVSRENLKGSAASKKAKK
jgi:hypothetical protein